MTQLCFSGSSLRPGGIALPAQDPIPPLASLRPYCYQTAISPSVRSAVQAAPPSFPPTRHNRFLLQETLTLHPSPRSPSSCSAEQTRHLLHHHRFSLPQPLSPPLTCMPHLPAYMPPGTLQCHHPPSNVTRHPSMPPVGQLVAPPLLPLPKPSKHPRKPLKTPLFALKTPLFALKTPLLAPDCLSAAPDCQHGDDMPPCTLQCHHAPTNATRHPPMSPDSLLVALS